MVCLLVMLLNKTSTVLVLMEFISRTPPPERINLICVHWDSKNSFYLICVHKINTKILDIFYKNWPSKLFQTK